MPFFESDVMTSEEADKAYNEAPSIPISDAEIHRIVNHAISTGWAKETMMMINRLTPEIKGKAFDPGWFMLRQRLEAIEERLRIVESNESHQA